MPSSSDSARLPQSCARYLERARDVASLTQAAAQLPPGFERQEVRRDLKWAQHELACEVALEPAARELAGKLAAAGDAQAAMALVAANALPEDYVDDLRTLRSGVYRSAGGPIPTVNGHPFTALRQRLEEERSRGTAFSSAWHRHARATGSLRIVLECTKEAWRCAYVGEPDRPFRFCDTLAAHSGEPAERVPVEQLA